eukprot:g71652.t1
MSEDRKLATNFPVKVWSLHEQPKWIEELGTICFNQWPAENIDLGINNVEEYRQHLRHTMLSEHALKQGWPFSLVAVRGNELLGTVSLDTEDMSTRRDLSPWLVCMLVKPAFRGQGVAKLLLQEFTRRARARGPDFIHLWCKPNQTGIYSKYGFQKMERTQYCGTTVDVMRWNVGESRRAARLAGLSQLQAAIT